MYKVMLVDDEALIRDAISKNMKWEELGYHLEGTCKNGKEAIEFLRENTIDLVITDICMPFVDGLQLSKHIYENNIDTKVIILSGYNEFEYAKTAVKYQVIEYILKPVTVSELSEILLRIKEILTEEQNKKESLQKLTRAYNKNLPILRTRYLNQLAKGVMKEKSDSEIFYKLKELDVDILGEMFKTALLVVENYEEFLTQSSEVKQDLPSFILYNILEEIAGDEPGLVVFQDINNDTVLIIGGSSEHIIVQLFQSIYDKCREILKDYFGFGITVSLGYTVKNLKQIHISYESALSALEYRFLYGKDKILDIRDFGGMDTVKNIDISEDIKKLALSIKINNKEEILTVLNHIVNVLRNNVLSSGRIHIYIQNILAAISNLMESADLIDDAFSRKQNDMFQSLFQKKTLEEVEESLGQYCLNIGDSLSEQRDSFSKKQAIIAKEYIDKNYGNQELTLQTLCYDLAISMSYFSTIYKKYTGETFVESLTKKRMQKSMELLKNTSMKVYEIAEKVGFSDPHYFAITFKKFTGMTPKEYAKEGRAN
ncbi:MAG: response regulator [Anaerocolumna sp.]|nr:response regulator [Anaerocolumna sp.]